MGQDAALQIALRQATQAEAEHGIAFYLYWNPSAEAYDVTPEMPCCGEWYTSDGVRHG